MKWMLSVTVFMMVMAGLFSNAVADQTTEGAPAAENAHEPMGHTAAAHGEGHGEGHGHSVGIPQPVADLSKSTLPGRVTLTEPKALAKVGPTVTLKWTASEGAEVYHLQVAKDPRFKWLVVDNYQVTGDSFETPNLEPGPYFWRVAGRKPLNEPSYTKGYFTTSSFEVR